MKMPAARWNDGAWVDKERRHLVQELLAGPLGLRFRDPVQWFYDPMAVTAFAGHMGESAIVFDCMDQLSQFKGSPKELIRRERELLAMPTWFLPVVRKSGATRSSITPTRIPTAAAWTSSISARRV